MNHSTMNAPRLSQTTVALCAVGVLISVAGCSSINLGGSETGQTVDYRAQAAKTAPLEVPPDLTQLNPEGRFGVQAGRPVSANTFGQAAPTASTPGGAMPVVAPQALGEVQLVREGETRKLVTRLAPEVVYQRALAFWKEAGFSIDIERPEAGVIETDWAENRAKLPKDFIRNIIGRIADGLYSTGERDRYRTRIERTAQGTEITISHRGLAEVGGQGVERGDSFRWTARPSDPSLEAEFTYRLMARLGAPEGQIQAARGTDTPRSAAAAPAAATTPAILAAAQPERARLINGRIEVDEAFDRAWRRLGLALDRGGFTVEDRDRAGGLYFVRYIDRNADTNPGLMDRVLNVFRSDDSKAKLSRYRIQVRADGDTKSLITVLNTNGQVESSATARAIADALFKELR